VEVGWFTTRCVISVTSDGEIPSSRPRRVPTKHLSPPCRITGGASLTP